MKPDNVVKTQLSVDADVLNKKSHTDKKCIYCEGGTGFHICFVCSVGGVGVPTHMLESGAGFGAW